MAPPLLRQITTIAVKAEAVEGVAETLVAGDAKYLVITPVYKPEPQRIDRNVRPVTFAKKKPLMGIQLVRITFRTEIVGSGTVDVEPTWGLLLKACGFKPTVNAGSNVQFDPVTNPPTYGASNGFVTLTIGVYEDGKLKKARGCRGTVKFTGESGQIAYADWDFVGIYDGSVDSAYPALAAGYDANLPPLVESAVLTLHAVTGADICIQSFEIDVGNTIGPRFCANATKGIKSLIISDRNVKGRMNPEEVLTAATGWGGSDLLARLMASTSGAFSLTIGTVTGNKVTISAPAAEVSIDEMDEGERDGILTEDIVIGFYTPFAESATDKELRILTL